MLSCSTHFFSTHAEFDLIDSQGGMMPDDFSHFVRTISIRSDASNKIAVLSNLTISMNDCDLLASPRHSEISTATGKFEK